MNSFAQAPGTTRDPIRPGVSEFGSAMADLLRALPWAMAAALCDAVGDPVDFAYRPSLIDALDVQLFGSQLTRTLQAIGQGPFARHCGSPVTLLESDCGILVLQDLGDGYILSMRMLKSCDLPKSMGEFDALARALVPLIFEQPAPGPSRPRSPQLAA